MSNATRIVIAICGIVVGSFGWNGFMEPNPSRWPLVLAGTALSMLALLDVKRAS